MKKENKLFQLHTIGDFKPFSKRREERVILCIPPGILGPLWVHMPAFEGGDKMLGVDVLLHSFRNQDGNNNENATKRQV